MDREGGGSSNYHLAVVFAGFAKFSDIKFQTFLSQNSHFLFRSHYAVDLKCKTLFLNRIEQYLNYK